MPSGKNVVCQHSCRAMDNASGHTGKNTAEILTSLLVRYWGNGPQIQIQYQPPESPDTNVNDLAFFPHMSSCVRKYQRSSGLYDLDALLKSVEEAWEICYDDKITSAFTMKTLVAKKIVEVKGQTRTISLTIKNDQHICLLFAVHRKSRLPNF